jgi:hypothetical protein
VGCWLFNETSGLIAYDSSGFGNRGTLTNMSNPGTPTSGWTSGPNGSALAFDGSNDNVGVNSSASLNSPVGAITVYARAFPNTGKADQRIVWRDGSSRIFVLHYNPSGANQQTFYYYQWAGATYQAPSFPTCPPGSWYSLVGTYDGAFAKIYVNGVLGDTHGLIGTIPSANVILYCGTGGSNSIEGLISDVMIWNRALSAQEVADLYANPYQMFDPEFPLLTSTPIYGVGA